MTFLKGFIAFLVISYSVASAGVIIDVQVTTSEDISHLQTPELVLKCPPFEAWESCKDHCSCAQGGMQCDEMVPQVCKTGTKNWKRGCGCYAPKLLVADTSERASVSTSGETINNKPGQDIFKCPPFPEFKVCKTHCACILGDMTCDEETPDECHYGTSKIKRGCGCYYRPIPPISSSSDDGVILSEDAQPEKLDDVSIIVPESHSQQPLGESNEDVKIEASIEVKIGEHSEATENPYKFTCPHSVQQTRICRQYCTCKGKTQTCAENTPFECLWPAHDGEEHCHCKASIF
ncbi:hypothetical protein B7494_g3239 [Chlorociboria aeruginascens]|nr:hypothetical protein B7494_g3239 [Chlorociboria aeruginascens]